MEIRTFVGRWVMVAYESPPPPWCGPMPLGTGFEILKNFHGVYWLPSPSLKSPLNGTRKLLIDDQGRGEFPAGESLAGSLRADFGEGIGVISFTVSSIGQHRRIIALRQVTSGDASELTSGTSYGIDD